MNAGDNNSTTKLAIERYRKDDGSPWVRCKLLKYPGAQFIPSFLDLHRILQAIGDCEDEKYPWPAKGRGRLVEFLRDAVYQRDFGELARKYQIPERDGDRIVNTNGAKVDAQHKQLQLKPITDKDINWQLP